MTDPAASPSRKAFWNKGTAITQWLESPYLTTLLLAISVALLFLGTIEQAEKGLLQTRQAYVESWFFVWQYPAMFPLSSFLHFVKCPLPGGYSIGTLLSIHLICRWRGRFLRAQKTGLTLIHLGILILVVGQFFYQARNTVYLTSLRIEEENLINPEQQRPFLLKLEELTYRTYQGTNIPEHFSAGISLTDIQTRQSREAYLGPNTPLRTDTFTIYLGNYDPKSGILTLKIVINPLRRLPYAASFCIIIGGLLQGFIQWQGKRREELTK
ncbi:MAG: cytochrome c biogenesis protein ResB [Opitutales bacterium]|nr:cytochrome c biogenesis protein ResB [Opitutales bacterium]